MFNNNRSDFAATIGGFFLVGFFAACLGISHLDIKFNFDDVHLYIGRVIFIATVLGIFAGLVCLYKAFLTEGMTFLLVSVCSLVITGGLFGEPSAGISLSIAFLVAFAIVGYMGYREGYLDLAIINGLFGAYAFFTFGFAYMPGDFIHVLLGIVMILVSVCSFYVAVVEWMGAQDFIHDYEEAMFEGYCDDDCNCGCDEVCECEKCGCESKDTCTCDNKGQAHGCDGNRDCETECECDARDTCDCEKKGQPHPCDDKLDCATECKCDTKDDCPCPKK